MHCTACVVLLHAHRQVIGKLPVFESQFIAVAECEIMGKKRIQNVKKYMA